MTNGAMIGLGVLALAGLGIGFYWFVKSDPIGFFAKAGTGNSSADKQLPPPAEKQSGFQKIFSDIFGTVSSTINKTADTLTGGLFSSMMQTGVAINESIRNLLLILQVGLGLVLFLVVLAAGVFIYRMFKGDTPDLAGGVSQIMTSAAQLTPAGQAARVIRPV